LLLGVLASDLFLNTGRLATGYSLDFLVWNNDCDGATKLTLFLMKLVS
jgi:hypothetical protein